MRARRTRKLSDVHEAPDTEAAAAAGESVQVRRDHLLMLLHKLWFPEAMLCLRVGLRDVMPYEEGASRQWRNAGGRPISTAMPEMVWQQIRVTIWRISALRSQKLSPHSRADCASMAQHPPPPQPDTVVLVQPAPKRRGRPPKAGASAASANEDTSAAAEGASASEMPARKRGRPSKKGKWLPKPISYPDLTDSHFPQGCTPILASVVLLCCANQDSGVLVRKAPFCS